MFELLAAYTVVCIPVIEKCQFKILIRLLISVTINFTVSKLWWSLNLLAFVYHLPRLNVRCHFPIWSHHQTILQLPSQLQTAGTNMCANGNICRNIDTCTALHTKVCAVHMHVERWIHTLTDFVFPISSFFYCAFSMLKLINIVILISNHQCINHLNHSKYISSTYINILIQEELCHARFQFPPNVPLSISVHYEELIM